MKKLVPVFIWLLFAIPCQARIITVDDDGPADFNTIQASINDANHGDIIEVQPGTYTGDGNRDIDFLGKAITVRSIDPNDPNIVAATIIDCNGTLEEPHRGFYFHCGENSSSILNGVTITNGYITTDVWPDFIGGGAILCEHSSPTIVNCIIIGNRAYYYGGGIYCDYSSPKISNCIFSDNWAWWGGGMANIDAKPILTNCDISDSSAIKGGGMYNINSNPILTNCRLSRNYTFVGYGGGMYNEDSSPIVTNCIFSDNWAHWGGGMTNIDTKLILTNCIFKENLGHWVGGGMYSKDSNSILTNCIFTENWTGGSGGGISNGYDSNTILTGCIFNENSATSSGGGMSNHNSKNMKLTNCTFSKNSALLGGGMYNVKSNQSVINCTFSGNLAEYSGGPIIIYPPYHGFGGGMYDYKSCTILVNCTFTGNRASGEGGAIRCLYTPPPPPGPPIFPPSFAADVIDGGIITENQVTSDFNDCNVICPVITNCIFWDNRDINSTDESAQISVDPNEMSIVINYSCIQSWTGALGGTGNIYDDPCFVEPGYLSSNGTAQDANDDFWVDGDYHLLADSPCIDAGDPNYIPEPNETDLDGRPRVIGGRIDMGAYEAPIFAEARIVPRTINLISKGKWITALLWLPEDYNVADIEPNSVLLEGQIKPERLWLAEDEQVAIAKFSREEVQSILDIGEVELTISGRLTDGTIFEATDTIKVIDKGGGKPAE